MAKKDYTKYTKRFNEGNSEENTNNNVEVEPNSNEETVEVLEETIEEATDKPIDKKNKTSKNKTFKTGVVKDCRMLNVRKNPEVRENIIFEIPVSSEVKIIDDCASNDFYKICTTSGLEGYCMKKYIEVR